MKRVHPSTGSHEIACSATTSSCSDTKHGGRVEVLTVWRKSQIFNCNGFTVLNSDGNLVFRVDSYSSGIGGEFVLMNSAGKALVTCRRKKWSLRFGKQWMAYDGACTAFPLFAVNKYGGLGYSKTLANVTPCSPVLNGTYGIEGSYARRSCVVYGEGRQLLAEIRQKEAAANGAGFGADVFSLAIYQGMDTTVAMAIVVLLDQMF